MPPEQQNIGQWCSEATCYVFTYVFMCLGDLYNQTAASVECDGRIKQLFHLHDV